MNFYIKQPTACFPTCILPFIALLTCTTSLLGKTSLKISRLKNSVIKKKSNYNFKFFFVKLVYHEF